MSDQQPRDRYPLDVAIIGAGPIGIELALALRHAGVTYGLIDAGNIGSTFIWWAPGTRFFSSPERIAIAGVPLVTLNQEKATREDYLAYLRGVVQQFDINVMSGTRVTSIARDADGFSLRMTRSARGSRAPDERSESIPSSLEGGGQRVGEAHDFHKPPAAAPRSVRSTHPLTPSLPGRGEMLHTSRVVLAIGNMHRPRMIDVPGENLPDVSHYLADPHVYFGRRVLVVGGKNSAVEAAIRLHRVGAYVTISYRGETFDPKRVKYWLRPELEWLISKNRIAFHPRTLVQAIEPDHVRLCSIDAGRDARTTIDVPADDVLLLTGYVQDSTLFEQVGVELECDERKPKHDSTTMQSNVPGVYVAGTAAGGSQKRARLFIENTHVHVQAIVRDIAGVDVPWKIESDYAALQES